MKRRTILYFSAAICGLLLIGAGTVQAKWRELDKVTASDRTGYDCFGISVGMSGDCAIVGAYSDDDKGSDSGSAYLFADCPTVDLTDDCFVDFEDFALLSGEWLKGIK